MIANNAFPYRYFGCFAADCKAKGRAGASLRIAAITLSYALAKRGARATVVDFAISTKSCG
jgi:hypothetical protein